MGGLIALPVELWLRSPEGLICLKYNLSADSPLCYTFFTGSCQSRVHKERINIMTIETVINNALEHHDFKQATNFSKEELATLLTEILKNYPKTNEFKDGVWDAH